MPKDAEDRIRDVLMEAKREGVFLAVYMEPDTQSYEVVKVADVDSDSATLLCYNVRGEEDGRRVVRVSDVLRVDREVRYLEKIRILNEFEGSVFVKSEVTDYTPSMSKQLQLAMDHHELVWLADSDDRGPIGFVTELGEDYVEVERITQEGDPDGRTMVHFDMIRNVHIGRQSYQAAAFLFRYRHGLKRLLE